MIDRLVEIGLHAIEQYGLVVLFVVFVFEGAIVGKIIPSRTLFVGALLLVGGGLIDFLSVYLVAVAGSTVGQCGLFGLIRYYDLEFDQLTWVPIQRHQLDRAAYWFDNWGLPAVAVSNTLPLMRGSMTVPVAMSKMTAAGFVLASGLGNIVYVGALSAIAEGIETVVF